MDSGIDHRSIIKCQRNRPLQNSHFQPSKRYALKFIFIQPSLAKVKCTYSNFKRTHISIHLRILKDVLMEDVLVIIIISFVRDTWGFKTAKKVHSYYNYNPFPEISQITPLCSAMPRRFLTHLVLLDACGKIYSTRYHQQNAIKMYQGPKNFSKSRFKLFQSLPNVVV